MPIFPMILCALDVGAAIEALCRRERMGVVYWLAAATLTWCVATMQKGGAR